MLASLVVAGLVAAAPFAPIGPDGRLVAPEGWRATLPDGIRFGAGVQDGTTVYAGARPDGTAFVRVQLLASGDPLRCDAAGVGVLKRLAGTATPLAAFRNGAGHAGCLILGERQGDRSALALALVAGPGGACVSVLAVSTVPGEAHRLARAIASSVAIDPPRAGQRRPRAPRGPGFSPVDPRLPGCFRPERSPGLLPGSFPVTHPTRCFGQDHSFEERSWAGTSRAGGGGGGGEAPDDPGRWNLERDLLEVATAQAHWTARAGLEGDDLLLDGKRWRRVIEAAPDARDDE